MRLPWHRCPADCGRDPPVPGYRDTSHTRQTSPDQLALEEMVAPLLGPASRVLHVGIGRSSLARRLSAGVAHIDGITVVPAERDLAPTLANYRTWLVDKHGPGLRSMPGPYDIVVDNNPGTFACCRRHFEAMFDAYAALLAPGGRIVTHARGAGWAGAIRLRYRHWVALGEARGLVAGRLSTEAWVLVAEPRPLR